MVLFEGNCVNSLAQKFIFLYTCEMDEMLELQVSWLVH